MNAHRAAPLRWHGATFSLAQWQGTVRYRAKVAGIDLKSHPVAWLGLSLLRPGESVFIPHGWSRTKGDEGMARAVALAARQHPESRWTSTPLPRKDGELFGVRIARTR